MKDKNKKEGINQLYERRISSSKIRIVDFSISKMEVEVSCRFAHNF